MKVVMIDAQFPELKGGVCNQRGKGTGASVKAAASRAMTDLFKQKGLKRKHFTLIKAIISVGTVADPTPKKQLTHAQKAKANNCGGYCENPSNCSGGCYEY